MHKKGNKPYYRESKMVKVSDNWYPNYPENMVEVLCFEEVRQDGFRVAVWGADDFGMEIYLKDKGEAKAIYKKLDKTLSQEYLRTLGFQNA